MKAHSHSNEYDLARYFLNEYDASDTEQSLIIRHAEDVLRTVNSKDVRAAELIAFNSDGVYHVHARMKGVEQVTSTMSLVIEPVNGRLSIYTLCGCLKQPVTSRVAKYADAFAPATTPFTVD